MLKQRLFSLEDLDDRHFDLIGVGRVGIDLYPLEDRVPLAEVTKFGRFLGGSSANVMVAAARYGRSGALVARTGEDAFGDFIRTELKRLGVDSRWVTASPEVRTTLAFCELFPPDDFPLTFYRDTFAPELRIEPDDLDSQSIAAAKLLWIAATGFSGEPSASAHWRALDIRKDAPTVIDLDYRPGFWSDKSVARKVLGEVLKRVSVAVGNQAECEVAVGETDPDKQADALLERGVQVAVVKLGPEGVLAATNKERVRVPPTPVQVVNGLGAGDAFGGALAHGILSGWELEPAMRFASTAGAIVAGRRECATAMPCADEVQAVLAGANPSQV